MASNDQNINRQINKFQYQSVDNRHSDYLYIEELKQSSRKDSKTSNEN